MSMNEMDKIRYNRDSNTIAVRPEDTDIFFAINIDAIEHFCLVFVEDIKQYALTIDLKGARIIVKNVRPNEGELLDKFLMGYTIM